jgi:hypothetical protein
MAIGLAGSAVATVAMSVVADRLGRRSQGNEMVTHALFAA